MSKPPLAAWLAAAAIRRDTLAGIASPDPARRDVAYRGLAWDVRWPALLSTALGRRRRPGPGLLAGSGEEGIVGPALLPSSPPALTSSSASAAWPRQTRHWCCGVTLTNLCLAASLFRGKRWGGCLGRGRGAGLAVMAKGWLVLAQSLRVRCWPS